MKLQIHFLKNGYSIMIDDGITPMEFVDKTPTSGIPTLKEAIGICIDHGYQFEVI
jgi:hypothetical protein